MSPHKQFNFTGILLTFLFAILNFHSCEIFSHRIPIPANPHPVNIYKVALTQKGYIQFLRYITEIPSLKDFTFCIWLKSTNFTYSHSLLSYSHKERDRCIRTWISPLGEDINLAIHEINVLKVPVHLKEHQWYHICQSWSSINGYASLYINGKMIHTQFTEEAQGTILPPGGDLVVGQEYTDFDKGLEDGIEGFIFGFNMVLESAFSKSFSLFNTPPISKYAAVMKSRGPNYSHQLPETIVAFGAKAKIQFANQADEFLNGPSLKLIPMNLLRRNHDIHLPVPVSHDYHPHKTINRPYVIRRYERSAHTEVSETRNDTVGNLTDNVRNNRDILSDFRSSRYLGNYVSGSRLKYDKVPLGKKLIDLGYKNCINGRGAPLSGPGVLISWTMTPVRVFGGAILKPAEPVCGNF